MAKSPKIEVGRRVQYASAFLKSTCQNTGWAPFARGTVLKVETFKGMPHPYVEVKWDDVEEPKRVLGCNLSAAR